MLLNVLRFLAKRKLGMIAPSARGKSSSFNAGNIVRLMVILVVDDAIDTRSRNSITRRIQ